MKSCSCCSRKKYDARKKLGSPRFSFYVSIGRNNDQQPNYLMKSQKNGLTLSKMGNSDLKRVQTKSRI